MPQLSALRPTSHPQGIWILTQGGEGPAARLRRLRVRSQALGQRLLGATNPRPARQVAPLVPRLAPLLTFSEGISPVSGAAEQSQSQV